MSVESIFKVIINYFAETPIYCVCVGILISKLSRDVQINHLHGSVDSACNSTLTHIIADTWICMMVSAKNETL